METDEFHALVGEAHGSLGGERNAQRVKRVLVAHEAEADGAMTQVRRARFGHRVHVDVDHVVEHAHGGLDGALEARGVNAVFRNMIGQG